ncbi:MAG: ABC transporter ATP-binding protein [Planctomycetota bacterium]
MTTLDTAPASSPPTDAAAHDGTRITLDGVVKRFGSGSSAALAVAGVDLTIEPGELFFLLGPSGCGKTTLLRMLAGFIEPTKGRIRFGQTDVTDTPPNKRNTGMVFQSYALWPHMTVAQNVEFGLSVRKQDKAVKSDAVAAALEAVQMTDYAKRKPNQLSGGQQQRVALARALVIRPEVLLLDEPLSNLDAKLRNDLRLEIRRICKEAGLTTVYVTHDQKEALSIADRIAIMKDGHLMQVGAPRELYRQPKSRFVAGFLGETNFLDARVVGTHADGAVTLKTAAGAITAAAESQSENNQSKYKQNDGVLCMLRPEAIRLVEPDAPGALRGERIETVYLGEVAHHAVRVGPEAGGGGATLNVSELNPPAEHLADSHRQVGVRIEPSDVVILPGDQGNSPA